MNQAAWMAQLNVALRSIASSQTPWHRPNQRQRGRPVRAHANLRIECLEERTLLDSALGPLLVPGDPTGSRWVRRLYHDLLQRLPEASEVAMWTASLQGGSSPAQVAQSFTASAEYRTNLIRDTYWAWLGRTPEQTG